MMNEYPKDILFDIDMQLYNEFNDKFCKMNDNLGTIYTYKDLDDLEKAEKEKEIKLIREAVRRLQKQAEELQAINQMQKYRIEVMDERELISRDEVEEIIKIKIEENKWAIEHYDCDEADYKQSQAIGAWNVLRSILDKIKGGKLNE